MLFAFAFGVDEDIIKVYYHKNVELLCQNLVDVALEHGRCVSQSKRHHLVPEMAIVGPEGRLLFSVFPDFYSIIGIGQIELGETSSPTLSIQYLSYQKTVDINS